MTASSHTHPPGATDVRDSLGYALREIRFGTLDRGRLHDYVAHAPDNARQSIVVAVGRDHAPQARVGRQPLVLPVLARAVRLDPGRRPRTSGPRPAARAQRRGRRRHDRD
jgi:hypothetical protein